MCGYNDGYVDYLHYKLQAVKWASIALRNRREGMPWQEAARLSHEALTWALTIIRG